jgi:hypothetical protein
LCNFVYHTDPHATFPASLAAWDFFFVFSFAKILSGLRWNPSIPSNRLIAAADFVVQVALVHHAHRLAVLRQR